MLAGAFGSDGFRSHCASSRGRGEGDGLRQLGSAARGLPLSQHGPRVDDAKKRTGRLDQLLSGMADDYEVAFLDCPPSVSLVSENVLRAAHVLLVPLILATLSLHTYAQLTRFVADAPRPRPEVVAFFSMADRRKRLHREVIDPIRRDRGRIADTVIPSLALIEQMAERRAPVPAFASRSIAARCYEQLWAEVGEDS